MSFSGLLAWSCLSLGYPSAFPNFVRLNYVMIQVPVLCVRVRFSQEVCATQKAVSVLTCTVSARSLFSSQAAEGHPRRVQGPGALLPRQMKVSHHCHPHRLGNSGREGLGAGADIFNKAGTKASSCRFCTFVKFVP